MSEEILNNVEVEEQKSFVLPAGGTIIKKLLTCQQEKSRMVMS